jgi:hypothetical protein
MRSAAAVKVNTELAVLGTDGHVVVILGGGDAPVAARDWQERGYRVLPVRNPID